MALIDISQLPVVVGLTGAEIVPVVQSGVTKRTTTGAIASATFTLDQISSTQGAILYRGASAWTVLNPGTSGQVLVTQGAAANPIWASNDVGLTIGTTAIAGGATTRILYDNAGILGEYTITGTGTVVAMQTSPTFVTPTLGVAGATSLTITQGTITADTAQLSGTATWSNAGVTFTGWKLNVTDTASASASMLADLQIGGGSRLQVLKTGFLDVGGSGAEYATGIRFRSVSAQIVIQNNVTGFGNLSFNTVIGSTNGTYAHVLVNSSTPGLAVPSDFSLGFTSGSSSSTSVTMDAYLSRDAADIIAQRRSTNAQTLRVYNTFTDASNYERAFIGFSTNVLQIGQQAAGTGTARNMQFVTNGSARWTIDTSGNLLAATDNSWDIGASGATRPRNIYAGTTVTVGGNVISSGSGGFIQVEGNGTFRFGGQGTISSAADGVMTLANAANNDFGRLQLGGTTSSFPALKRSATVLQARLADDSDFAPLQGRLRSNANATAEVVVATHTLRIFDAAGTEYKVLAIAA